MPALYAAARSVLFKLPAERAHEVVIDTLSVLPGAARRMLRRAAAVDDERLKIRVGGLDFPNPVGLAAGFDKGGRAFNALGALGFGFVEIGTVTAQAQPGNPKPRLFRLPADRALLNRMGFNNPGAEAVASRLERSPIETILGVNVGKSKVTPLEEAIEDYLYSIAKLERYASYLVINVSSPNTAGLRELQDAEPLRRLLRAVSNRPRPGHPSRHTPVFLKVAPDLGDAQMEQAVGIAIEERIAGIIAVNTTISRDRLRTDATTVRALGAGGISGVPLRDRALQVVARIHRLTGGSIPIVGVGGIFTVQDAWDRIRAGASLVQLYTGFVYEGPGLATSINRGLLDRLEHSGLRSITDAVGIGFT